MMLGHWHLRGFGIWAVEEKSSQALIGRIGLQLLEGFNDVELVWMLKRSAWGKGFAAEGAAAVVDFAFQELGLPQISAVIRRENLPSSKLAKRLGMELTGELHRQGVDFYEYHLRAPDPA
jgi:RimJ/RimL family protein N-acetyltransferase